LAKRIGNEKSSKRKGTPGFVITLIVIGIFVIIGSVAYFLLTRMGSNEVSYQIPQVGENQIGVFLSGRYVQSINSTDKLQRVIEEINTSYDISSIRIIMFGSLTCPHCKAMDAFFSENYSGIYRVIWITGGSNSSLNWFVEIASEEVQQGIPEQYAGAVPHTLILDNSSRLRAIVIGEITDKGFWDLLLGKMG